MRRIIKEEARRLRETDNDPSMGSTDKITSATAHKILDMAQEACELAADGGIDYGDPYEATMRQLQDFLATITA